MSNLWIVDIEILLNQIANKKSLDCQYVPSVELRTVLRYSRLLEFES